MIDTSSPKAATMFGLLGPSSPLGMASFQHSDSSMSWSDFPMYDEATQSKDECPHSSFAFLHFEPDDEDEIAVVDCFSSSWPAAKYPPKVPPTITTSSNSNSSNKTTKGKKRPVPGSEPKTHEKTTKVRFAPTLEVRTHSIVPGIHPSCEDGLALELGWDYEVSRDIMPCHQPSYEDKTSRWRLLVGKSIASTTNTAATNPYPRLLPFEERKRLLIQVGGFSEAEIETSRYKAKFLLAYDDNCRRVGTTYSGTTTNNNTASRRSQQQSSSVHTININNSRCSNPQPRVGSVRRSLSVYAAVA